VRRSAFVYPTGFAVYVARCILEPDSSILHDGGEHPKRIATILGPCDIGPDFGIMVARSGSFRFVFRLRTARWGWGFHDRLDIEDAVFEYVARPVVRLRDAGARRPAERRTRLGCSIGPGRAIHDRGRTTLN